MNIVIKFGLILGVTVGVLGFALPTLGLHTHESAPAGFVGAAIAINVIVVFIALRQMAADSGWGRQVLNGLVLGVVGAAIIFLSSFTMTTLVFPEYYVEFAEAARARAIAAGLSPEEIEIQVASATGTPASSAFAGAVGTVVTSAVVAAIMGFFTRAR